MSYKRTNLLKWIDRMNLDLHKPLNHNYVARLHENLHVQAGSSRAGSGAGGAPQLPGRPAKRAWAAGADPGGLAGQRVAR